jgi:beta-mannosidase
MRAIGPGAVQLDWARAHDWPAYWAAENFRAYDGLEDHFWTYETRLEIPPLTGGERLFFICGGVDYAFEVTLNRQVLHRQEGMFTPVELELTDRASSGDVLRVIVHPAPKSVPAPPDRSQANRSCKPAVSYGWDFHPRLIPLGIWQDTYLEIRPRCFLRKVSVDYRLTEDFSRADLLAEITLAQPDETTRARWVLRAPDGTELFHLTGIFAPDPRVTLSAQVKTPPLWWPHDQGVPALHTSTVELLDAKGTVLDRRVQRIGFRSVRLVMAPGQWEHPATFPKSRSHPPMTLEINGRAIFAKGANWVSPDIFPGLLGRETYAPLLTMARTAHMNLLRLWGGAPAQKESFYDLCDEMGIMAWQEFPLACNAYPDDSDYLDVLDQESRSLIARLKPHACIALWCGGNELFNAWSGMTDHAWPLRLLASNCYQLDPMRPFLPTSPVDGVGHGHYVFRDPSTGDEAWSLFQASRCTAYTEFGMPAPASVDVLREIIPENELFPPRADGAWQAHHAFGVWMKSSHLYLDVLEHYFGPAQNLAELVERGQLLQAEGYKGLYEEARRQKPAASMALCWCLNEPWPTAANASLISWPARPKPALAAVADACRPLLASARIRKFEWMEGEVFDPELWWLHDAPAETTPGPIEARVETTDGRVFPLLTWNGGPLAANTNLAGPKLHWVLPALGGKRFTLALATPACPGAASRYVLRYRPCTAPVAAITSVMNLG